VSHWPLRFRLVAGFSVATLIALVAAGAFVYWRVEYALDRGLDTELRQAANALSPLVTPDGAITDYSAAAATGVAWQVLNRQRAVLSHGGPAGPHTHAGRHWLVAAAKSPKTYNVGDLLPVSAKPYRVRVSRLPGRSDQFVLVAVRRDHRDEALRELLVQLTVAGVAMLAFSSFVGDRLARAALSPVERYRRQAAAIAAGATDLRLDVPVDRDDEVTRLGHTFNEMLASLDRSLQRERQFVNEASHELRTPITLLTARLQLARRRARSAAEHEEILDELAVDLARLADLAEHLLQVGAAADRPSSGACDLVTVAQRVVDQRRETAAGSDLICLFPSEPIHVALTDVDAERVLGNVLDNARTHGVPPVEFSVDEPVEGWARVTVADAGGGMSSDLLHTATQRFTRADDARSRPGAGLGLALVESLVTSVGGAVRLCHDGQHVTYGHAVPVECTHGPAMTVTIMLPARPVARAQPE
jgi:two-component system OmpR family sensor kinase